MRGLPGARVIRRRPPPRRAQRPEAGRQPERGHARIPAVPVTSTSPWSRDPASSSRGPEAEDSSSLSGTATTTAPPSETRAPHCCVPGGGRSSREGVTRRGGRRLRTEAESADLRSPPGSAMVAAASRPGRTWITGGGWLGRIVVHDHAVVLRGEDPPVGHGDSARTPPGKNVNDRQIVDVKNNLKVRPSGPKACPGDESKIAATKIGTPAGMSAIAPGVPVHRRREAQAAGARRAEGWKGLRPARCPGREWGRVGLPAAAHQLESLREVAPRAGAITPQVLAIRKLAAERVPIPQGLLVRRDGVDRPTQLDEQVSDIVMTAAQPTPGFGIGGVAPDESLVEFGGVPVGAKRVGRLGEGVLCGTE